MMTRGGERFAPKDGKKEEDNLGKRKEGGERKKERKGSQRGIKMCTFGAASP